MNTLKAKVLREQAYESLVQVNKQLSELRGKVEALEQEARELSEIAALCGEEEYGATD